MTRQSKLRRRSFRMGLGMSLAGLTLLTRLTLAATFSDGQSILVREGDSWSSATIIKHEGRRFLIHYAGSDSSTDEWVGTDRMRASGAAGATPAPPPVAPSLPPASPAVPAPAAPLGKHVEHADMPPEVIPEIEPNRSAIEEAQVNDPPSTWSVPPDPAVKPLAPDSYTIHTKTLDDKFDVQQLLPCADGGAVLGFTNFGEKDRRLERVGTKASGRAVLPAQCLPMAASPSGKLVVCRSHAFGFHKDSRIDAFVLNATDVTPLVSFTPYPAGENNKDSEDIRFATALSETRIITFVDNGDLVAWDIGLNSATGVWHTALGKSMANFWGRSATISPGGKWIAVGGDDKLTFVDSNTGHVIGVIEASDAGRLEDVACSPSGKTVVARSSAGLLLSFDIVIGRVNHRVAFPQRAMGALTCPDDGFAMVDNRALIDAATGIILPVQLEPNSRLAVMGPGIIEFAGNTKLMYERVPDSKTKSGLASMEEGLLALKPGMPVSVDIQLDEMDDAKKQEVDAAIRKKLTDDGFIIAPTADTVVICRTEPGSQHEHRYVKQQAGMPFAMFGSGGDSMILTDKVTRITIQQKGQTLWEEKRTNGPAMNFRLKDGQSLEDGARESIHYDPEFLINVVIPGYIAKPEAAQTAPPPRFRRPRN